MSVVTFKWANTKQSLKHYINILLCFISLHCKHSFLENILFSFHMLFIILKITRVIMLYVPVLHVSTMLSFLSETDTSLVIMIMENICLPFLAMSMWCEDFMVLSKKINYQAKLCVYFNNWVLKQCKVFVQALLRLGKTEFWESPFYLPQINMGAIVWIQIRFCLVFNPHLSCWSWSSILVKQDWQKIAETLKCE